MFAVTPQGLGFLDFLAMILFFVGLKFCFVVLFPSALLFYSFSKLLEKIFDSDGVNWR